MPDLSLNHLALVVEDLDAALDFWSDCLGLTPAGAPQSLPDEAGNCSISGAWRGAVSS